MSKGGNTIQIVRNLCIPIADELNISIWDIQYIKEGTTWYLKIFIDKDSGVTVSDCEIFHNKLSDVLDKEDPIDGSYWLEVSSPGLEREFTEDWQYEKYIGSILQVNLVRPIEKQKLFIGELLGKDDSGIHLLVTNENIENQNDDYDEFEMTFLPSEAAWIRQYYDFSKGEELEK